MRQTRGEVYDVQHLHRGGGGPLSAKMSVEEEKRNVVTFVGREQDGRITDRGVGIRYDN